MPARLFRLLYRVLEVVIGGMIGSAVLVAAGSPRVLTFWQSSEPPMMLDSHGREVCPSCSRDSHRHWMKKAMLRRQDHIGQAFVRLSTIAVEAMR